MRRQLAKALTDGLEAAIVNGDTAETHMDAVVRPSLQYLALRHSLPPRL